MILEKNKLGQVWIETVLYTLIGLALIGMVLTFALPKINSTQNNILIDQSIGSLRELDELIMDMIDQGAGNRRTYEIQFSSGELDIDSENDKITFYIKNIKEPYSEEDVFLKRGPVEVVTRKSQGGYDVFIELNYAEDVDLKYSEEDIDRRFGATSSAYEFSITNIGSEGGGKVVFDFEEISGK